MIVFWLPRALSDYDKQIDYIAKNSPKAALEQGDCIERQVALLSNYPQMGRIGRKRGTRELVVNRTQFIVVYRVRPKAKRIEILRILHGAQQYPHYGASDAP